MPKVWSGRSKSESLLADNRKHFDQLEPRSKSVQILLGFQERKNALESPVAGV
jgi:hypothetical protein